MGGVPQVGHATTIGQAHSLIAPLGLDIIWNARLVALTTPCPKLLPPPHILIMVQGEANQTIADGAEMTPVDITDQTSVAGDAGRNAHRMPAAPTMSDASEHLILVTPGSTNWQHIGFRHMSLKTILGASWHRPWMNACLRKTGKISLSCIGPVCNSTAIPP